MFTVFTKPNIISPQDKDLTRLLEKIRDKLEVSKGIWSEYLGIPLLQYEKVLKHKEPLSAASLYYISERLNLNPSVFESGKIDFSAALEAHRGNRLYINPEYKIAASSRKFTVVNTMNFVEKYRGKYLRVAATRHLQIHEDFWNDWEDPASEQVNIRLLKDLWTFLRSRGLGDEDFQAIGYYSASTLKSTHIGNVLSSFSDPRDIYECLFGDFAKNIEQNHLYKITALTADGCIVESRANPAVASELAMTNVGSVESCQIRIGMMQSMPTLIGMPAAAVHETHCVHKGHSVCRFFCDFSTGRQSRGTNRRLSLLS